MGGSIQASDTFSYWSLVQLLTNGGEHRQEAQYPIGHLHTDNDQWEAGRRHGRLHNWSLHQYLILLLHIYQLTTRQRLRAVLFVGVKRVHYDCLRSLDLCSAEGAALAF